MTSLRNSQLARTVQEINTSMSRAGVLAEAKAFFAGRSGVYSAFLDQESASHVSLRGQGGEEIVIGTAPGASGGTRVTASTYLFDQQVARFLASLPPEPARDAPPADSPSLPAA